MLHVSSSGKWFSSVKNNYILYVLPIKVCNSKVATDKYVRDEISDIFLDIFVKK